MTRRHSRMRSCGRVRGGAGAVSLSLSRFRRRAVAHAAGESWCACVCACACLGVQDAAARRCKLRLGAQLLAAARRHEGRRRRHTRVSASVRPRDRPSREKTGAHPGDSRARGVRRCACVRQRVCMPETRSSTRTSAETSPACVLACERASEACVPRAPPSVCFVRVKQRLRLSDLGQLRAHVGARRGVLRTAAAATRQRARRWCARDATRG
jgi:hypothetical protein